jgi:hypothetical protein
MRRLVLLALVGCGDNLAEPPPVCEIEPPTLPAGPVSDPYAYEIAGCVEGGLADAAGRWFVRPEGPGFGYLYPLFDATCDGGVRLRDNLDRPPPPEGYMLHEWWDGTRWFDRFFFHYEDDNFNFDYVIARVICMQPDGTLAGWYVEYNSDAIEPESKLPLFGTRFDRKDTEAARGLELLGAISTSTADTPISAFNLDVDAGIAYVAGPSGLELIDVADPSAPRGISHLDESWNDVRVVHGQTATVVYGASNGTDTIYVDATDPTSPYVAGAVQGATQFPTSHSLQVANNRLYVADYSDAVPVFDISDPLAPIFLGAVPVPNGSSSGIHDLTVEGDQLFVNQTTAGFTLIDTSGGIDAPQELARMPSSYSHASAVGTVNGQRLALHGDEGMTGPDGGAFLRVLDAGAMTEVGRYQSRPEVGIHNFVIDGNRAYIAYYQDGVRVVDLADPAKPREIAHYNTWDPASSSSSAFTGAFGIRVVDGLIYVADSERGLLILRETP